VDKALNRTDPLEILNAVIVAVPFDRVVARKARDPIHHLDALVARLIPKSDEAFPICNARNADVYAEALFDYRVGNCQQ
jgi:hypothetical protein